MQLELATILAGLAAGALHVLSGPDHLAAVLPGAISARWKALRVGLAWGLGHGLGVILLGGLAILFRSALDLSRISSAAEILVGLFLLLVGARAIAASRRIATDRRPSERHTHKALGFGLIHGLAGGSHLLGALPALALGRGSALIYLLCFLIGGAAGMAVFSLGAVKLVQRDRWVPAALACSGGLAMAVGGFWLISSAAAF